MTQPVRQRGRQIAPAMKRTNKPDPGDFVNRPLANGAAASHPLHKARDRAGGRIDFVDAQSLFGKFQIGENIMVTGIELAGSFKIQHRLAQLAVAETGIAEIEIHRRRFWD